MRGRLRRLRAGAMIGAMGVGPHRSRLLAAIALTLLFSGCGAARSSGGTSSASCVGPYLDAVPPNTSTVEAAKPVSPGDSLKIYGHWFTSTCNDTGGHDPLKPLPPVHLTLVWPSGAVQRLGEFTPAGDDMGFSLVVHVPDGMPAGIAKVRDDQDYPSTYKFQVAG